MKFSAIIFRIYDGVIRRVSNSWTSSVGRMRLRAGSAALGKNATVLGIPLVDVSRKGGVLTIGDNFSINSGVKHNRIGRQQKSMLIVGDAAHLSIGNNVGISSTAIICLKQITIGNNVKIGGNTVIYDTDFHSMDPLKRGQIPEDVSDVKTGAVAIGNNVFIGAHTTILKGTTIGDNSVIGAGSVVRGNIPPGEIWLGNPATFFRKVKT